MQENNVQATVMTPQVLCQEITSASVQTVLPKACAEFPSKVVNIKPHG